MQTEKVAQLLPSIKEHGVRLVYIGSGNRNFAMAFIKNYGVEGELFIDPGLKSFQSFQLKRGAWAVFKPSRALLQVVKSAKHVKSSGLQGDGTQQGGAFLIGSDGRLMVSHINSSVGDHFNVEVFRDAIGAIEKISTQ